MEMRSGTCAAPVWGWRCFLCGYAVFYAQATDIQEDRRKIKSAEGPPKILWSDSVLFGRLPLAIFGLLAYLIRAQGCV